jgi:hypothetical protein
VIDPKQALEDAATHVEAEGAVQVWLTEAMIRHWQADALEAAALECKELGAVWEREQHWQAVSAAADIEAMIDELKPEAT